MLETFLGIDYGTKRVGVAVGNSETKLATPLVVLENSGLDKLTEDIVRLATVKQAKKIILGESKNFQMQDNQIMSAARQLAQKLSDFKIEIIWEPEMLTSHQAQHLQGKNALLDASAAAIILQSYLDKII